MRYGMLRILMWLTAHGHQSMGSLLRGLLRREPKDTQRYCLVGNVGGLRESEGGPASQGTKHFSQGTKVHCLPAAWGDGYERIIVVGRHRRSKRLITVIMPSKAITNWRVKSVHHPEILRRLDAGCDGVAPQWRSRKDVASCAQQMREHERTNARRTTA